MVFPAVIEPDVCPLSTFSFGLEFQFVVQHQKRLEKHIDIDRGGVDCNQGNEGSCLLEQARQPGLVVSRDLQTGHE